MSTNTFDRRAARWELMINSLTANAPDVPQIAADLKTLQGLLDQIRQTKTQQEAAKAHFAEITNLRRQIDQQGEDVRIRISHALKATYGFKSDKLIEFGLRPPKQRRTKKTPQIDPGSPAESTVPPGNPAGPQHTGPAAEPVTK